MKQFDCMQLDGKGAMSDGPASSYETMLNHALSPSGEGWEYFARVRVQRLHKLLKQMDFTPATVLDYGCGVGGSVAVLEEIIHPSRLLGVDISAEAVQQARKRHGAAGVEFALCQELQPHSEFHVAFCNGVFHHISADQRVAALRYVYEALRPGGIFALWENNPWNPGTRYIMRRCEFDRGATLFSHLAAKKLLASAGFEVLQSSSHFYFPRWLRWLRPLEPMLAHLPLGGQYVVLGRKPSSTS